MCSSVTQWQPDGQSAVPAHKASHCWVMQACSWRERERSSRFCIPEGRRDDTAARRCLTCCSQTDLKLSGMEWSIRSGKRCACSAPCQTPRAARSSTPALPELQRTRYPFPPPPTHTLVLLSLDSVDWFTHLKNTQGRSAPVLLSTTPVNLKNCNPMCFVCQNVKVAWLRCITYNKLSSSRRAVVI